MNTSQPNRNPTGSDNLDTLLGAAYSRLVNDLTVTLDLDAGAAQATHATTYSALTNDLAQQLSLDAGLAAIVTGGSPTLPDDAQPHQPASPHLAMDEAQDLGRTRTRKPDELSPQEAAVAQLARAGRTNRKIAQQLHLSIKTVETHLGHIYQKLGIRSRWQLTERVNPNTEE